jgi:hypothetical protein
MRREFVSPTTSVYRASILFGHEEVGTWALGLTGSHEKAGSRPNKMLALC